MAETADPRAALGAKDIPTRAAATRDLALAGTLDDVDVLLVKAVADPSQGVRLGAAAAAADIVARHRLGGVDPVRAEAWLKKVAGVDPSVNIGLFQVCGVLDFGPALRRIFVGLRDPRADVRMGACVGLWRCAMSARANGDDALREATEALVRDPKVRPETRADLARVCANVGWTAVRDDAVGLRQTATKTTALVLDEAIRKFDKAPSVEGIWVDYGVDGGATVAKATVKRRLGVLSRQDAFVDDGTRGPLAEPVRTLWLKAPGEDTDGPALQFGLSTVYAADADEVCAFGDTIGAAALVELDPVLPPTAAGGRVRAVRLLAEGDVTGAVELLEQVVAGKKVPADAWWYLADALHLLGRDAEAAPHLETYLKKAPKKAPFVEEARRRSGGGEAPQPGENKNG